MQKQATAIMHIYCARGLKEDNDGRSWFMESWTLRVWVDIAVLYVVVSGSNRRVPGSFVWHQSLAVRASRYLQVLLERQEVNSYAPSTAPPLTLVKVLEVCRRTGSWRRVSQLLQTMGARPTVTTRRNRDIHFNSSPHKLNGCDQCCKDPFV